MQRSVFLFVALLAPSAKPPEPTQLTVEVRDLGDADARRLAHKLRQDTAHHLQRWGIPLVPQGDRTLRILVDAHDDPTTFDFTITLQVLQRGEPLARRALDCRACSKTAVAQRVAQALPELLPALRHASPPPQPPRPPALEPRLPSHPTSPTSPAPTSPPPPHLGPMAIGGAVLTGTGLAALAAGLTLLGLGQRPGDTRPARAERELVDHRPIAIPFLAGGLLVGAAGAVVLGLHHRRPERARALACAPAWSPRGAGIRLHGRF